MITALGAEDVLCADESPTTVVHPDANEHGEPVAGSPHAVTVGTPDARLVWYATIGSRSKPALAALGVLDGYAGYLVRDDYAGYYQFDTHLAGVGQCAAHLIRHCKGVLELHPTQQKWAGETSYSEAPVSPWPCMPIRSSPCCARPPPRSPTPKPTSATTSTPNSSPTYAPATTTRSDGASPPTGTAPGPRATTPDTPSPNACTTKPTRSSPSPETSPCPGRTTPPSKLSKAPNDIRPSPATWHTLSTLADCRGRSYLVSARNHGVRPVDAIHAALTGNPRLPTISPA